MLKPLLLCAVTLLAASRAAAADASEPPPPIRYQLGLLSRGPTWTPERNAHTDSIQAGHMANMVRMADAGVLIAAGPFANDGDLQGVFVFAPDTDSLDGQLAGDPAIASGRLECRLSTWIAPPGLGEDYRRRKSTGARDSMVTLGWVMIHRGPKYDSRPSPKVENLIREHFEYTEKLRASGQLLYAGSIEGTGELRGVLVMQGDSAAVARAMKDDPAVRAGRFTTRIMRWWTAWGTIPGH